MAEISEGQRERRRARQRVWYQRHKAEKVAQVQAWKNRNPDRVLEVARRRRERRDDEKLRAWYRSRYPSKKPREIEQLVTEYKAAAAKPSLHWTDRHRRLDRGGRVRPHYPRGEYPFAPVASRAPTPRLPRSPCVRVTEFWRA